VLEQDGDHLDRSYEKLHVTKSQGGEEYPATVKRRKANWIGHMLRRNCLLKNVIEGKIEGRIGVTEDEEEDVLSYWKALRKRMGPGN